MQKSRGLKRWWIYLAAVALADGKSAFRLGRSSNLAVTMKQIQLGSPLPLSRTWALPACSEKAACAAARTMERRLGAYLSHGGWMLLPTDQSCARQDMKSAMDMAKNLVALDADSKWVSTKLWSSASSQKLSA